MLDGSKVLRDNPFYSVSPDRVSIQLFSVSLRTFGAHPLPVRFHQVKLAACAGPSGSR